MGSHERYKIVQCVTFSQEYFIRRVSFNVTFLEFPSEQININTREDRKHLPPLKTEEAHGTMTEIQVGKERGRSRLHCFIGGVNIILLAQGAKSDHGP